MQRSDTIAALRAQLAPLCGSGRHALPLPERLQLGAAPGEPLWPHGLPQGCLHEIEAAGWDGETGIAAASMAAMLLGRLGGGMILWTVRDEPPFPPRLASFGLDPDRVIFCRCRNDAEALAALADALRAKGIAAAVGEVSQVTLTESRRLQLVCEAGGATGLILRRQFHGAPRRRKAQGSAAATRWRIGFAATDADAPGLGPPRWRADLLYRRGGMPASYLVEWNDETGDVRLVAKLADHEAVPHDAGVRRAG